MSLLQILLTKLQQISQSLIRRWHSNTISLDPSFERLIEQIEAEHDYYAGGKW